MCFVGDIAQLVERTHGMREVTGSTPVISTSLRLSGPSGSASFVWLAPSPKEPKAATGRPFYMRKNFMSNVSNISSKKKHIKFDNEYL